MGYPVPNATSSTASIDWAKTQLENCVSSHSNCVPNLISTLPARVIDVGTSSDTYIRLLEPEGESGRYLCLSHCWGAKAFLCTRRANLAIHKDSIALRDLPPTFEDAVHFTRLLGVRYLWIDSLCIVQDDDEDWRKQSAEMADIYANAYLTIAAMHAESPFQGLFSTLKPEMRPHALSVRAYTAGDRGMPEIYARQTLPHIDSHYLGSLSGLSPSTRKLPLLQRAWFFQERFLSQRVLYFAASELAWQCSSQTICQCRGEQDVPNIDASVLNNQGHYHTSTLIAALQDEGREEVMRRWLSLVGKYSTMHMTFERDMLPALSGLAKKFGNLLGSQYAAGIWEDSILPGLLWHPVVTTEQKKWGTRPREWRAPSWSWASANTAIAFPNLKELVHPCRPLNVECQLRGPHATGEMTGGHMVVQGLVCRTKVIHRLVSGERLSWNVYDLDLMDAGFLGNRYADYDWMVDGPGKVENGSAVYCLLVGAQAVGRTCYLLVLKEVGRSDAGSMRTFERIGLVEVFGHKVRKVSPDGTISIVSPFDIIEGQSVEETIKLV